MDNPEILDEPLTAEDVRSQRFPRTQDRAGYNEAEVDAFMARAADALAQPVAGALTAADVVAQRFSPTRLKPGYDEDAVDAFMARIAGSLRRAQ